MSAQLQHQRLQRSGAPVWTSVTWLRAVQPNTNVLDRWKACELFRARDRDINFYFTPRHGIVQRWWPRATHQGVGYHIHPVRRCGSNLWSLCPIWSWHWCACNYIWPPIPSRQSVATLQSLTTVQKNIVFDGKSKHGHCLLIYVVDRVAINWIHPLQVAGISYLRSSKTERRHFEGRYCTWVLVTRLFLQKSLPRYHADTVFLWPHTPHVPTAEAGQCLIYYRMTWQELKHIYCTWVYVFPIYLFCPGVHLLQIRH